MCEMSAKKGPKKRAKRPTPVPIQGCWLPLHGSFFSRTSVRDRARGIKGGPGNSRLSGRGSLRTCATEPERLALGRQWREGKCARAAWCVFWPWEGRGAGSDSRTAGGPQVHTQHTHSHTPGARPAEDKAIIRSSHSVLQMCEKAGAPESTRTKYAEISPAARKSKRRPTSTSDTAPKTARCPAATLSPPSCGNLSTPLG